MKELQERLMALSTEAYARHQAGGDSFALKVADITAGLALRAKQLAAAQKAASFETDYHSTEYASSELSPSEYPTASDHS